MVFKVGDKVKCVDPPYYSGLTFGKVYTVVDLSDGGLPGGKNGFPVMDDTGKATWFNTFRFEKVGD